MTEHSIGDTQTLRLNVRIPGMGATRLYVRSGHFVPATETQRMIDLSRWYAIPPMGDGHAHLAASTIDEFVAQPDRVDMNVVRRVGRHMVEAGVFSAIDKGDQDGSVLGALDEPLESMPDLEMAGPIHRPIGGYYAATGIEVDDTRLVAAAAQRSRARWFKIIGDWPRPGRGPVINFDEAALRRTVRAAHGADRKVAVHTMAPDTAGFAVRAGVDSIEHGLFLQASDLELLGARRGYWVPTIGAMEDVVDLLGATSSGGRLLRRGLSNVRGILSEANRLGVRILAGTDLSRHRRSIGTEARLLVDYGLTPAEAFRAATSNVHAAIGKTDALQPGAPADLVCVDGDPREDIEALSRVRFVLRRGRIARHEV